MNVYENAQMRITIFPLTIDKVIHDYIETLNKITFTNGHVCSLEIEEHDDDGHLTSRVYTGGNIIRGVSLLHEKDGSGSCVICGNEEFGELYGKCNFNINGDMRNGLLIISLPGTYKQIVNEVKTRNQVFINDQGQWSNP